MSKQGTRTQLHGLGVFLTIAVAQFVTLFGSAASRFALSIWAYQTTGYVQYFALVLVVSFVPGIILSPFAGVLIDRKEPRVLILAGSILGGIAITGILAALLTGSLTVALILVVTALLSCASALQTPALDAIIPFIVPRERVAQANGIFSICTSASDISGPILAGIFLGLGNLTFIAAFDLFTYLVAILVALATWRQLATRDRILSTPYSAEQSATGQGTWKQDLKAGGQYLVSRKPLFQLVMLFTLLNFALGANEVIGQLFALSLGSTAQLGLLNAIFGAGMVLGSLAISVNKQTGKKAKTILLGNLGIGGVITLSAFAHNIWFVGIAWLAIGLLIPVVNTSAITILQLNTDLAYLGRVLSLERMLSWISLPVAEVIAGFFADLLIRSGIFQRDLTPLTSYFGNGRHEVYSLLILSMGVFIIVITTLFARSHTLLQLDKGGRNAV